MRNDEIIRAWKDAEFRRSLSGEELARLPQHPAGLLELTDDDLSNVQGAWSPIFTASIRFCGPIGRASMQHCHKITQQFFCKLF